MATNPAPTRTGSRETLWAILGSLVISIVLASVLAGNPFSALSRAYKDWGAEPYHGTPIASDTHAPANAVNSK